MTIAFGIDRFVQMMTLHGVTFVLRLAVQGPVVQSIVSLTSSLRGQLIMCFMTFYPNTLIFFVEKLREAFALQKLLTFFQQKILAYIRYYRMKF